jgi:hypothetical protein
MSVSYRKKPCRVCRKWYQPGRRGGHHQKTCGQESCKREWHRKKCREWRHANRDYVVEVRARQKMERLEEEPRAGRKWGNLLEPVFEYPFELGKAVMGIQASVFMEVTLKVLWRGLREVMRLQVPERNRPPP